VGGGGPGGRLTEGLVVVDDHDDDITHQNIFNIEASTL